jgi:pentatricopeptide repeat protein
VYRLRALLDTCDDSDEGVAFALSAARIQLDLPLLTKLIAKYTKLGQWRKGFAIWKALESVGVTPDTTIANAAIGACSHGDEAGYQEAWTVFNSIVASGLRPDPITYRVSIVAMTKSGAWERSVEVLVLTIPAI